MANIGGPKGPSDPRRAPGGGAKILPLKRPEKSDKTEKAGDEDTSPDPAEKLAQKSQPTAPIVTKKQVSLELPPLPEKNPLNPGAKVTAPTEGEGQAGRGAGVRARLAALGVKGAESLPIKTAARDAVGVKETPLGKILEGTIRIDTPRGLAKLEGVVRVTGDLVLQESAAKSPDLLALCSLIEVGGRLTIEGNASLGVIDALSSLERARGVYIGFNSSVHKIVLPKLKELDAALILEGNPALVEISLPAFAKAGLYLHVHDNASLTSLSLPSLATLGDELSLVDNPRLAKVVVGSREKPADVGLVELKNNGASSYPQLFVRIR
jgi:hypothetical protein